MKRRWWILGLLVVGVGAVALFPRGGRVVVVDVGKVAARDVFRSYVSASGQIVATRYADIGSSVMGKIVALAVAEGDHVKAGQVLARIDPVQARSDTEAAQAQVKALEAEEQAARRQVDAAIADLAQAAARAKETQASLTRVSALHRDGIVTTADLDSAQAAADVAAAQVRTAETAIERAKQLFAASTRRVAQGRAGVARASDILSKTEVVAPIDGVVSRLQVRLGEMVVIGIQNQPGTTLMTVSDLSAIDAEIKVAEADVTRIAPGLPSRVTLEAVSGREFSGRVVEVGASALPVVGTGAATREFRVVVRLDSPDTSMRPGMTCDAEVLTAERRAVLSAPLQAVVLRPGADGRERPGVFAVRDGRVRFVPVVTGIIGGLDIEVSGVERGTELVIGPFQVLRDLADGAAVRRSEG
ncbi:MAG: efflux RND transporter periplasmic adaptor subunit [Bacteroidales bacterium]